MLKGQNIHPIRYNKGLFILPSNIDITQKTIPEHIIIVKNIIAKV